jgi:hypothetical protein
MATIYENALVLSTSSFPATFRSFFSDFLSALLAQPFGARLIDVLQMMTATGNFPTEHIVDYSLIFE